MENLTSKFSKEGPDVLVLEVRVKDKLLETTSEHMRF